MLDVDAVQQDGVALDRRYTARIVGFLRAFMVRSYCNLLVSGDLYSYLHRSGHSRAFTQGSSEAMWWSARKRLFKMLDRMQGS